MVTQRQKDLLAQLVEQERDAQTKAGNAYYIIDLLLSPPAEQTAELARLADKLVRANQDQLNALPAQLSETQRLLENARTDASALFDAVSTAAKG